MIREAASPRPQPPRVIITKLRPPRRRRDLLTRERLNAYISDNLERKLLLVSAPAGYGKTSLLVDYAGASGVPVCWYRVDPADRDPVVFFEHLVGALRQRFPDTCPRTLEILRAQAQEGQVVVADVVASLVNEIHEGIDAFFQFVLDDYQNIDDAVRVNEALDGLLHYLPDSCQLVLVGRTVPRKLTLTRLAGAGLVAGIGQELLRFTAPEIGQLVATTHGRTLSAMECERLVRESEGWITALILGGPRLLDGVGGSTADREQLFAFLAQEVLARQPVAVQSFLVQSAVLDDLSPAACDAVLSRRDGANMLAWLEDHNLFVTRIEADEVWHRYHQLFRDFLRARLHAELAAADIAALHRRAAAWCATAERPAEEIHHLVAAGEHAAAAARMAEAAAAAHRLGQWQTIIDWTEALPASALYGEPVLVQHLGTALTYSGELPRALEAYDWAVAHHEAREDGEGVASVLVRRAVLHRRMGRFDASLADARRALALTADPDIAGMGHRALGGTLSSQGDLGGAVRELDLALQCFQEVGDAAGAANAHGDLSAICQWAGDLTAAVEHAELARHAWEHLGHRGALALALNNLGTAYHGQGDFEGAGTALREAVRVAQAAGYMRAEAGAAASLGDLLVELDDARTAISYYDRSAELAHKTLDSSLECYALAARALAHCLLGDLGAARDGVARAEAIAPANPDAYERALVHHVRGSILVADGEIRRAEEHFQRAEAVFRTVGAEREAERSRRHLTAALHHSDQAAAALDRPAASRSVPPAAARSRPSRAAGEVVSDQQRRDASASERLLLGADRGALHLGPLVIRALGKPEVVVAGARIARRAWQSAVARSVLFYLADRPEGASRDELMAVFWPDSTFVRARSSLHSALHRVRRAVGTGDVIQTDFERYFVRWPGGVRYDVGLFETELGRLAGADDDATRAAILEEATSLARGEYMAGVMEDWCAARRADLEAQTIEAWLGLGSAQLRLGRVDGAVQAFQRVLAMDPAHERAHRGLMKAFGQAGDRVRALRQFEACQQALAAELGVAPDRETVALYDRIACRTGPEP